MTGKPVIRPKVGDPTPDQDDACQLVESTDYNAQLRELAEAHPDWHIRPGQALMWDWPT